MKFATMLVKFPSGIDASKSAGSAQKFHTYLSERAHSAEFELPMVVRTEEEKEGKVGHVIISAGAHAPVVLDWIREWRAKNPDVAHSLQSPEGLPDDDFRNEIAAR